MPLFSHEDKLRELDASAPLLEKIEMLRRILEARALPIDRVAVATYDAEGDVLHTFIASNDGENPLVRYESRLADAPSLLEVREKRAPRVVNDLTLFAAGSHTHTHSIAAGGFRASYTVPIFAGERFVGFVFFNSRRTGVFDESLLDQLDVIAHLLGGLVAHDMLAARMLSGALKTASDLVHARDPETWGHLQRMARYVRLIAQQLADDGKLRMTDEAIERLFWFAPMHDIGKLAVPDAVLFKPARLSDDERSVMREHSSVGGEMLDRMIHNFELGELQGIDSLRDVALMHHEALDGSGYPRGLSQDEIPMMARIVAVADIFDALTSPRSYKQPWPVEAAMAELRRMAVSKLDPDCVEALASRLSDAERIRLEFAEEAAGERISDNCGNSTLIP
ncbi:MAG: HD domain-containing protein [Thermoanaerobaculia bacterium]|nr:HD domain-containing protein [Thermoanaerobaculia bacterium]